MADDTLSTNCGCGPPKVKNAPYLGGDDLLITSLSRRCLPKDKSSDCGGSCGCESAKEPHGLELAHGLLKRLQAAMSPYCGCPSTGPLSINLANGNAVLKVAIPATGPFDAGAKVAYNSRTVSSAVQFEYVERNALPHNLGKQAKAGRGGSLHTYLRGGIGGLFSSPSSIRRTLNRVQHASARQTLPDALLTVELACGRVGC